MRSLTILAAILGLAACGNSGVVTGATSGATSGSGASSTTTAGTASTSGHTSSSSGHSSTTTSGSGSTAATSTSGSGTTSTASTSSSTSGSSGPGCGTCPASYTCGTANGHAVCRAPSGIPLFTHVFVILEENMSLMSVKAGTGDPFITSMVSNDAMSTNYTGVGSPSLPNYLALTSGEDVSAIGCDCQPTGTACTACNLLSGGACGCPQTTRCLADDLTAANLTWHAYAESMGTPCNVVGANSYAPKHVPFLYYPQIQTDASVCDANIVDFSNLATDLSANTVPSFSFITPNLTNDGHDPAFPSNTNQNIVNIDSWLGAHVPAILSSQAYTSGGLVVIVWDEDDLAGTLGNPAIPIFVLSPYAKNNGFSSAVAANHYSLLATFEDGLGLPRLGKAAQATPLVDFFPAN